MVTPMRIREFNPWFSRRLAKRLVLGFAGAKRVSKDEKGRAGGVHWYTARRMMDRHACPKTRRDSTRMKNVGRGREKNPASEPTLSRNTISTIGALYPPPPSFSFNPRWIDDRHDETIASNSISKIGAGKVREVCVKSTGTRVPITRCRSLMARTPRVKLAESWERSRKTARKEKKERFAKLVRLRFMWETDDDEYRENHP